MKIEKVFLNGVELSKEVATDYFVKYVTTEMAVECFFSGIEIETPVGKLQAEVSV